MSTIVLIIAMTTVTVGNSIGEKISEPYSRAYIPRIISGIILLGTLVISVTCVLNILEIIK